MTIPRQIGSLRKHRSCIAIKPDDAYDPNSGLNETRTPLSSHFAQDITIL
jgi:hypothetical protein